MTLALLLFWICFFLLTPVFVLQWFLSIRKFWSQKFWSQFVQFPLTFLQAQKRMPLFTAQLTTILMLIGTVFMIILEMFHGRISLNLVLLLQQLNFVSESRLQLMCISLDVIIKSSLIHFHGFQLLVLQP